MKITERLQANLHEERQALGAFLRLLAKVDFHRMYSEAGFGSLYRYCVEVLGLSEQQAYLRINVCRLGRRWPEIFDRIERGELHMSAAARLGPVLQTSQAPQGLIAAAAGKSKRQVERMLAEVAPKPDRPNSVLPDPLSPDRFHISVTVSERCVDLLDEAQDLGAPKDGADLLEAALEALVEKLKKTKLRSKTKRQVFTRDHGRCTYEGPLGRCKETARTEFDHVHPKALGGTDDATNLRVLCRTHNQLEARRLLGPALVGLRAQGFKRT